MKVKTRVMNQNQLNQSMTIEGESIELEESRLNQTMEIQTGFVDTSPNKHRTKFNFDSTAVGIFFGKSVPHIYTGSQVTQMEKESFGPIILDPKDSNIYKAWEKAMISKLENFKSQEGEDIRDARKIEWIETNPGVLTFQIRRATYNVEQKKLEKYNGMFTFEDQICIDRFMLDNKDEVETIRSNVLQLEKRIEDISSELENVNSYGEGGQGLDSGLKTSLEFLEGLISPGNMHPASSITQRLSQNPSLLQTNLALIRSTLGNLSQLVQTEKSRLENERYSLQEKVKASYRIIEKTKYRLFSIIMHEGTAEYGHYYAFIRDGKQWYKFNDFTVTIVEESEVFELAYGGKGAASAYCIFYVQESIPDQQIINTHALMRNSGNGGFYQLLDLKTRLKVETENKKYQTDLLRYRVDSIISQYSKKIEILRNNKKENTAMIKEDDMTKFKPNLKSIVAFGDCSIPSYLRKGIIKYDSSTIFNWLMLGQVVQSSSKEKFGREYTLSNIYENEELYNILSEKLRNMNADMRMSDVLLDTDQHKILESVQKEYIFRLRLLFLFDGLLDALYNCEFDKFFQIGSAIIINGKGSLDKNYQFLAGSEFARIGIIKCFYLYLWVFKTSQENKIQTDNQFSHLQNLINFLRLELITKPGYVTQIQLLAQEMAEVLPNSLQSLAPEFEQISNSYKARKVAGEYYKSAVTNPQPLPSDTVIQIYSKIDQHMSQLMIDDPNPLEEEIKQKNNRCNKVANDLLIDDSYFLQLHKQLNQNNTNIPIQYKDAAHILGDMTRYYKQFEKL